VSQVRTLTPNFTVVTLKMCAYSRKIAQIGHFWYKFAPKGVYPLKLFLKKIWLGEGFPALHPHAKFYRCGFKMWAYSHNNRKNW